MSPLGKTHPEGTDDFRYWGGPPAPVQYDLIRMATAFLCRLLLHPRIHRDPRIIGLTGPLIVLSNHTSYADPVLVAMTLKDRRINFLTTQVFFRNPWISRLLHRIGAIPKVQFRADSRALKAMLQTIARGGTLAIFPEGQRSIDGSMTPFDEAIAKLIRKTKSAVVVVHIDGGYLSWPRWSTSRFRSGRIDVQSHLLMTGDEIAQTDVTLIQSRIVAALHYQEYDWQRKERVRFHSTRPAEGLYQILHQCPSCLRELAMCSTRRTIFCRYCENTARMDDYGFLHPATSKSVVLSDVLIWHTWQLEQQRVAVQDPNFRAVCPVTLNTADGVQEYNVFGSGLLTLSDSGFEYAGVYQDQSIILHFPLPARGGLNAKYGVYFELASADISYRVIPDDGQKVVQTVDRVTALLDKKLADNR